jgi:cytidylate kinase
MQGRNQSDVTMPFIIAIDGPAASGKGTIARALAAHFGFYHLDTGLLYRATGAKGGDPVLAAQTLSAEDLARPDLRSAGAGQAASRVAIIPEVRAALVDFQRRFALQEPGAVLDGRDIGTVICPDAAVKLYVTASDQIRAARRAAELGADQAEMLAELQERDRRDSQRATAPLKPADDAVVLDTTDLSIPDAIARAIAQVDRARA